MRILFVSPRSCWPPQSGAALREYHLARALGERAELTHVFFSQAGARDAADAPFRRTAVSAPAPRRYTPAKIVRGILGGQPLSLVNYTSDAMKAVLAVLVDRQPFDLVHVDSIHMAAYEPILRRAGAPQDGFISRHVNAVDVYQVERLPVHQDGQDRFHCVRSVIHQRQGLASQDPADDFRRSVAPRRRRGHGGAAERRIGRIARPGLREEDVRQFRPFAQSSRQMILPQRRPALGRPARARRYEKNTHGERASLQPDRILYDIWPKGSRRSNGFCVERPCS